MRPRTQEVLLGDNGTEMGERYILAGVRVRAVVDCLIEYPR